MLPLLFLRDRLMLPSCVYIDPPVRECGDAADMHEPSSHHNRCRSPCPLNPQLGENKAVVT